MNGTGESDLWGTNLPYAVLAVVVTIASYNDLVAGVLVGLKDAGAAVLLVGIVVTLALDLLGYRRESLHESLFGR